MNLLGAGSAWAGAAPGCVLGPLAVDHPATLSDGTIIQFPACWKGAGTLIQASAPLAEVQSLVQPYGVHVLQKKGLATVAVGAFDYTSTPVGRYREVFTMTYVTDRPGNKRLSLSTMASMAAHGPFHHPSRKGAGFVLNSYIDADSAEVADRAVRLYQQVFGYGAPATITFGPTPETFKVVQDGKTLFDVHLPEVAHKRYMGLTRAYDFDFYLIGGDRWSRQVTHGRMGESTDFDGYAFHADAGDPGSAPFSGAAFSSPKDAKGTAYMSFRDDAIEMHAPIVRKNLLTGAPPR